MLAIWSLVPLPFLNPAYTSGSSGFTYCWSLAWWILSINWLACEMSANVHLSVVRGATECCPVLLCIHHCCYSVTKSCDSKESPHRIHYARFPCPSLSPRVCSNSCPMMPSNHLILCLLSPPVFNLSQHQDLFQWVSSLHQMAHIGSSTSASVLPMNI